MGAKHSGAATVLLGVLDALVDDARFAQIVVFCSPAARRQFSMPQAPHVVEVEMAAEDSSPVRRVAWYRSGLRRAAEVWDADVVLAMNGLGTCGRNVPTVMLVQQSLPFSDIAMRTLSFRRRAELLVMRRIMRASSRRAAFTFVQSFSMREAVRSSFGLRQDSVEVCYPSVGAWPTQPSERVRGEMGQVPAGNRLLYVGNDSPYKNLETAIRGLRFVRECVPSATLFATLPRMHRFTRQEGVVGLGMLGRVDLGEAYRMADVVVLPSLAESGPLVPREAAAMCRALLLADEEWAREAAGGAALYFAARDSSAFAAGAIRLLTDEKERTRIAAAGARELERQRRLGGYGALAERLCEVVERGIIRRG